MQKPILATLLSLEGTKLSDQEKFLLEQNNPVGVTLFNRNIADIAQLKALVNEVKNVIGRNDVLIGIDQEGGRVRRLVGPDFLYYASQQMLGELPIEATASHAELIANDLRNLGINVNFAPVLDVAFD